MEAGIEAGRPAHAKRLLVREFLSAARLVTARAMVVAAASAMALGCASLSAPSAPVVSEPPSVASPTPSPSLPSVTVTPTLGPPVPTMANAPIEGFDLAGTAWEVLSMRDLRLVAETPPSIEFDPYGRPGGRGFSGCDEFGFGGAFTNGVATEGEFVTAPEGCSGPGSDVEVAFLDLFGAVDSWSTDGDLLMLSGPHGRLALARELPPRGDPGRELAEAVRNHKWTILKATGVRDPASVSPIVFFDRDVLGQAACGYTGRVLFGSDGGLSITEVGWDTGRCGRGDEREAIETALQAVQSGRIEGPDKIRLAGPGFEVVLGR